MPVNHTKEFLKFIYFWVVFYDLFIRASNGHHHSRSRNFLLKISLSSVFLHAELKSWGCSWIWGNRACIIKEGFFPQKVLKFFNSNQYGHIFEKWNDVQVSIRNCNSDRSSTKSIPWILVPNVLTDQFANFQMTF